MTKSAEATLDNTASYRPLERHRGRDNTLCGGELHLSSVEHAV